MIARGSITAGGITNGGILAGGILASQTESIYRDHALYLDNTLDRVSGRSLSCLVPGTRYDLVNGVQTAFTENTPVITEKGLRTVGAYQNLCINSNTISAWKNYENRFVITPQIDRDFFVSPTITKLVTTGIASLLTKIIPVVLGQPYVLSIWIKGLNGGESVQVDFKNENSAGLAGVTRTLTPAWQLYYEVFISDTTGERGIQIRVTTTTPQTIFVAAAQVTNAKYNKPYIPTAGTASASVSESGTVVTGEATNGVFADEIASNFTLLNSALQNQGTLTLDWTPGYSAGDISGSPLNILSFGGVTNHLSYDPSAKAIRITDGTRTLLSPVIDIVANTTYGIKMSYGSGIMQLSVDNGDIAETAFDGSFNPGSDMVIGLNNAELQYVNNIRVLKEASHGTAATGLQEFFFDVINSTTIAGVFQTTGSITVYWGDGTSNTYNGTTDQAYSKTYAAAGNYTVRVVGKSLITKFTMTTTGANISCDLSELPESLNYLHIQGSNTIRGYVRSIQYFLITGPTPYLKYASISSWPAIMNRFYFVPTTVSGGLSSAEIDQLLIDLSNNTDTWTGDKQVNLKGTNAPRTSASDAAVATLISKGVTVTTN